MSQGRRFTAWLNSEERQAVEAEATRLGTPLNFVVRLAVRRYFGLPTYIENERPDVTHVTGNSQ